MRFLYDVPRCALWMPMGGGKTVTTLTALDNMSVVDDIYPVLVLAPLRVAKSTWPEEVGKWDHLSHLRVSVITGTPKQRERAVAKEADIYCMNYDNDQESRLALAYKMGHRDARHAAAELVLMEPATMEATTAHTAVEAAKTAAPGRLRQTRN